MNKGKTLCEVFAEEAKARGGARKGAGRKATGPKTVLMTFSLPPATVKLLAAIERGKRSAFIDMAIRQAIINRCK